MTLPQRRFLLVVACLVTIIGVGLLLNQLRSGSGSAPSAAGPIEAEPLATPVLSARRVPELVRSHAVDERLRSALAPIVAAAPADSCIVVSEGGRVVLDHRGSVPMSPASIQKLLVAAAALDAFGPDHRLQTTAVARDVDDGVVEGDLYLVGGGDPLLTTGGYQLTLENPQQLSNDFAQLADRLVAAGLREVRGGVVGDESRYDDVRTLPGWPDRYLLEGHIGPLSSLMVNDGSTGFTVDPDQGEAHRVPGESARLAAETLITLLEKRGVNVVLGPSVGRAPEGAEEIAALPSLPMSALVAELVGDSDNTTAELLVKELGLRRSARGTTAEGLLAVSEALAASGLPTSGSTLVDGSGLDTANRLSCDLVVKALDVAGADSVVGRSLAVAGETGTLRRRMRGTPAEGKVHAKSGTLNTVNALAGFAETPQGELTFAYVINGADQRQGYEPLDRLAAALVGSTGVPSVEALAPLDHPG